MPKIITRALLILILLAMFPPLLVALARVKNSDKPPVHPIQDMDNQPPLRAQHPYVLFADSRAMRAHPLGTVARGRLDLDDHFYRGIVDGAWATDFPPRAPFNERTLARGEARFNIYCTPCHGESGDGRGVVALRAMELRESGLAPAWVEPKPVFDPETMKRPVGELFNIVTNGINTMPAYAPQIPEADRWAIVAWVKVLQRAAVADWDEIPPDTRTELELQRQQAIKEAEEARKAREARAAEEAARANQPGTTEDGSN